MIDKKEKKKKRKFKKKFIILIALIIVVLILINPVTSIFKLKSKGYSFMSSFKIYTMGETSRVLDSDYSQTLDEIIDTDSFDKKYVGNYLKTDFYEYDDFFVNLKTWFDLGYIPDDVNVINKWNNKELNQKLSEKYIKDITSYLEFNFFKVEKLDRYLNYFNGDYKDTIVRVNIGLDKKYYEDPTIIKDYSIGVIVNKYNKLDSTFTPTKLVEIDNCVDGEHYLAEEAKLAYDKMCTASLKEGLKLGVTSAYRSYESQQGVYATYLKSNGQDYVNQYVATPGYSEHQTGLALDVKSKVSSPFKTTKEYKWMLENAYKYGFILRYEEGKEDITGYNPEAWHFRYVGEEAAKYVYENGITYEEYYAMFM